MVSSIAVPAAQSTAAPGNSDQHRNNAVWARKLENAEKADLASGWESFGKVVDSWEERADMSESSFYGSESNRANKKDSSTPVIELWEGC